MSLHEVPHDAFGLEAGQSHATVCQSCGASKIASLAQRLLSRSEVDRYLALSSDQVQSLINTRQVTVIRIKGEKRFDSRDLDLLINTYTETARRRAQ